MKLSKLMPPQPGNEETSQGTRSVPEFIGTKAQMTIGHSGKLIDLTKKGKKFPR